MKKMKCPNCSRRAFDISNLPKEEVEINLKCPQCGKFVSVPCNEKSELKDSALLRDGRNSVNTKFAGDRV